MTKVPISKPILQWAMDRSGLTVEDLERTFRKFRWWFEGAEQPTMKQLERLARKTKTPLGYFFLVEPPDEILPIPHYRTVANTRPRRPSPDLIETVQAMQQRQAWLREYLIEEREEPLAFVGSVRLNQDYFLVADNIRRTLGLGDGWGAQHDNWESALRSLQGALEETGILVVINGVVGNNPYRKLDVAEFRGFVLTDEYAPLIFVNGADFKSAQMFTLIHELVHIWYGHSAVIDLQALEPAQDAIEQACNAVAAQVLVPANELRRIWNSIKNTTNRFGKVAKLFKVSALMAARRALDLDLIDKTDFFAFYELTRKKEYKKQEDGGGDFYNLQSQRIGRRFARIVIQAAREGRLLYNDAYRLTGLRGKSFEQFAAKMIGKPAA